MAWYKYLRASKSLLIVEDQVSAMRMAPYMHTVALLGTHISQEKVDEMKAGDYKHIVLCLDNDATGEAIKLALKWQSQIPICIRGLMKDIKDMDDETFKEYAHSVSTYHQ